MFLLQEIKESLHFALWGRIPLEEKIDKTRHRPKRSCVSSLNSNLIVGQYTGVGLELNPNQGWTRVRNVSFTHFFSWNTNCLWYWNRQIGQPCVSCVTQSLLNIDCSFGVTWIFFTGNRKEGERNISYCIIWETQSAWFFLQIHAVCLSWVKRIHSLIEKRQRK